MQIYFTFIHKELSLQSWFRGVIISIICFALYVIGIVGYNIFIDPLLCFSHHNAFNKAGYGYNERQEKTNRIYFNPSDYNAILLGSSRATFVNQYDFVGLKLYNYAASSMMPFEYKSYIDFMKQSLHRNLDYIILQIDFFGSNTPTQEALKTQDPYQYINTTISNLYWLKQYLSKDAFERSQFIMRFSLDNTIQHYHSYYLRNNVKIRETPTQAEKQEAYTFNLKRHTTDFMGQNYIENKELSNLLKKIKDNNPHTHFIVYTSPITADLFVSIMKYGKRFEDYKKWLKLHIEIFGKVWQFMGINSITTNIANYPDDDHAYPFIGTLMAHKIMGIHDTKIPKDFEILLTKDNIDSYLQQLQKQIEQYNTARIDAIMLNHR